MSSTSLHGSCFCKKIQLELSGEPHAIVSLHLLCPCLLTHYFRLIHSPNSYSRDLDIVTDVYNTGALPLHRLPQNLRLGVYPKLHRLHHRPETQRFVTGGKSENFGFGEEIH